MCLILVAWQHDRRFKLVVAANRDEFFDRPALPLHWWKDEPDLLAGRDLEASGTWMGVSRNGRFAAVTNYREPGSRLAAAPSRGDLVRSFLTGDMTVDGYLSRLQSKQERYNGFSLLLGDTEVLWYTSNRDPSAPRRVEPGLYGLSNHLLDTPWPKVERGKRALARALAEPSDEPTEHVLGVLDDRAEAPPDALPDTGIGAEYERVLSPIRIVTETYGTRSSSALMVARDDRVVFAEQRYERGHTAGPPTRYSFALGSGVRSDRPK